MEQIILYVIDAAKIETTPEIIYNICQIRVDPNHQVFKSKKHDVKKDVFEDVDDRNVSHVSEEKALRFTKIVSAYVSYIQQAIQDKVQAPGDIWKEELACLMLRTTIQRDQWHENGSKTRTRSDFIFRLHHLFYLQMNLRFWRRIHKIMHRPDEKQKEGIWCNFEDFLNMHFYVDKHDSSEAAKFDIIRNWGPLRVYRALKTLRLLRCQGAISLPNRSTRNLYYEYHNALLDRVAMLAIMPVSGNLGSLNTVESTWFRLAGTASGDATVSTADSSYRVYSKEIKKYLKEEDLKDLKKHMEEMEEGDTLLESESAEVKAKRMIPIRARADLEIALDEVERLKQLRSQITDFDGYGDEGNGQWDFANLKGQLDAPELHPEDQEQVELLTAKITKKENKIKTLRAELEKAEKEYGVSMARKVATGVKNKQLNDQVCEAEPRFMKDFMLAVDGVTIWQEDHAKSLYYNTDSLPFQSIRRIISSALMKSVTKASSEAFLVETMKNIIVSTVGFYEREEYRINYSGGGQFVLNSVVASMRSEEHTVIKGFPEDVEPLLTDPKNDHYIEANNYFVKWWLIQQFSGLNVNRTVFLMDVEEESVSLDRITIKSPVISRLGDIWVILMPGPWTEKGVLECIRVDNQLINALVTWLFKIEKNRWIVHNRETDMLIDIRNLSLCDFWREAFPQ